MRRPSVIVFDVNETLSDLGPMASHFADVGAPESMAKLWFASLLRDGFALTAAGATERFPAVAEAALRGVLASVPLNRELDAAVGHITSGFLELGVHADVPDGVRAIRATGARLVTLTNGSNSVVNQLLESAGLRDQFERLLSVDDAGAWKPAPAAYRYAVRTCSVEPADTVLVAVHPWDIDGAKRAGLHAAWINRGDEPYPSYFLRPDLSVASLPELADVLG